jgi:glycogen synthase
MREPACPAKLLITVDPADGGWTYVLDLARALTEVEVEPAGANGRGIEVALATLGGPLADAERESVERIPRVHVFESIRRFGSAEEPWRDAARAGEWLLRLEERIGPDLVHLQGCTQAAYASLPWQAPRLVAAHACPFAERRAQRAALDDTAWERYRAEIRAGLQAADALVVSSSAALAGLSADYGPLPAARVVHPGRDARLFRPASQTAREKMVFAAGRLGDEAANLAALERAAPALPWPVYVASERRRREGEEIRPHHTHLLGRLTSRALAAWLGRAAIYVLPARHDPWGVGALDAALAGCTLVLSDLPHLREVWQNRAVFVSPDDPEALQDALLGLIENPERRDALAAGARARALALTPERWVEGHLAAYADLLAARAESAPARFESEPAVSGLAPIERIAV